MLGGEITFYRVRYTVTLDRADSLAPGYMLYAGIRVTLSERSVVCAPIALAL